MAELLMTAPVALWTTFLSFAERVLTQYKLDRRVQAERDRIYQELNSCTDRELAEIGFSRADLPAIANGTYQR